MADFFKGLAGGFQSGLQLGQAMRDKQQREELAQVYAKPESYTDYTPAQQQQIQGLQASGAYDVEAVPGAEGVAPTLRYMPRQGLDLQGDMPATAGIEIAPRQVQRYAGQVAEGQFDPMMLQGLRAREAARVVGSYGDPVRAAQLEADALRMQREAKMAPLQEQLLKQQVESGTYDIDAKQRAQAANIRTDSFNTWQAQNPTATPKDMFAKARELGMPVDEQLKVASGVTGLKEASLKSNKLAIEEMVQGKSLDELLSLHEKNDMLDPNSHYKRVPGKDGQVGLQRIDSKTGKPVGGIVFTGSEAEATRYLYTAATAPETVVDYTTNLDKAKAAIAASKATLTSALAQADAARARIGLTNAQKTQLDELNDNRKKALEYADQYEELDEKAQAGEQGRKLRRMFNMYNAKAGGQTALEREPKVSDAAVATLAKEMIGKPTGRRVNGVVERYTPETATVAARRNLAGQGSDDVREMPDYPK